MEPYSISLHNGTRWSRQHNIRGAGLAEKEAHIKAGGYHRDLIDKTIKQSYNETFGQAILDYNAKQTRPDRHIVDYLAKVRDEHKRDPKRKPHASYEMIITIGNRDHHPNAGKAEAVMEAWLKDFREKNPNVVVFGAHFHADEPDSAPHMHVDYYFVKRANKRGLGLQVSQNGALNEQGYFPTKRDGKFVTPQTQWQEDSRELLRSISKEHGLYVDAEPRGENRKHLDTDIFKRKTELSKVKQELNEVKSNLRETRQKVDIAKAEELRVRARAQRNEKRVEEAKAKVASYEDREAYVAQLESENARLNSQNKELKEKLSLMKRALNKMKSYLKTLTLGDETLWSKVKNKLFGSLGKLDYDRFQEIRHEDESRKPKFKNSLDWDR
ncbi:TPA: plasmid recombination protein [Streptococcus equi subsp. zooepidemicus]|nr:plasmid recombination protein [Streptococcus equi subsp. zooepidemicus]